MDENETVLGNNRLVDNNATGSHLKDISLGYKKDARTSINFTTRKLKNEDKTEILKKDENKLGNDLVQRKPSDKLLPI